jgi:hypothetical protein
LAGFGAAVDMVVVFSFLWGGLVMGGLIGWWFWGTVLVLVVFLCATGTGAEVWLRRTWNFLKFRR